MKFFKFFLPFIMGAGVWAQAGTSYLPHYTFKDGDWETVLTLTNQSMLDQEVTVQAFDNQGVLAGQTTWSLPPYGSLYGPVFSLIPNISAEIGWLRLQSDTDQLKGIMKFTFAGQGSSSLPLASQIEQGLIFPLIENTASWSGGFAVLNVTDQEAHLNLELLHHDGRVLASESRLLGGRSKLVSMVSSIFQEPLPEQAVLRITGDKAITGFALSFGSGLNQIVAVPAEPFAYQEPVSASFSDLSGTWESLGYGQYYDSQDEGIYSYQHNSVGCLDVYGEPLYTSSLDTWAELKTHVDPELGDLIAVKGREGMTWVTYKPGSEVNLMCPPSGTDDDPEYNFEFFWNTLNENHAYLAARGVDWQEVYNLYRPQVAASTTPVELFGIFKNMIAPLSDNHTQLFDGQELYYSGIEDSLSFFSQDFAAQNEFDSIFDYVSYRIESQNQIVKDHYLKGDFKTAANSNFFWGKLDPAIEYINVAGFNGYEENPSGEPQAEEVILSLLLDDMIQDMQGVQGVILDLRSNFGGNDKLGLMLATRFADRKRLAYSKRAKSGSGTTPFQSYFIDPNGLLTFNGPVIVLISPLTFSAAEGVALAMMSLPQVTLMGETTDGVFSEVLSKELPNGWLFSMSNETFLSAQGQDFEITGISPQRVVPCWTSQDLSSGVDSVLEEAWNELRKSS